MLSSLISLLNQGATSIQILTLYTDSYISVVDNLSSF